MWRLNIGGRRASVAWLSRLLTAMKRANSDVAAIGDRTNGRPRSACRTGAQRQAAKRHPTCFLRVETGERHPTCFLPVETGEAELLNAIIGNAAGRSAPSSSGNRIARLFERRCNRATGPPEVTIMAKRINRALELLAQDQAIYYVRGHTGHPLLFDRGRQDAHTWADYINIGMEH